MDVRKVATPGVCSSLDIPLRAMATPDIRRLDEGYLRSDCRSDAISTAIVHDITASSPEQVTTSYPNGKAR